MGVLGVGAAGVVFGWFSGRPSDVLGYPRSIVGLVVDDRNSAPTWRE
jgi:hypothetical protein